MKHQKKEKQIQKQSQAEQESVSSDANQNELEEESTWRFETHYESCWAEVELEDAWLPRK